MKQCGIKLISGLALLTMLSLPAYAEPLSPDQLSSQASSYLVLLDQGFYESAWMLMSAHFQALSNQSQWQSRQQVIRSAYGPLSSRKLMRISYRQTYTLSPDGQYIIVQFKSSFLNKDETRETVVLNCDAFSECMIREYIVR